VAKNLGDGGGANATFFSYFTRQRFWIRAPGKKEISEKLTFSGKKEPERLKVQAHCGKPFAGGAADQIRKRRKNCLECFREKKPAGGGHGLKDQR